MYSLNSVNGEGSVLIQKRPDHRRFRHVVRRKAEAIPFTSRKKGIAAVEPMVASFAPATVANLGPGFDWLGCAVEVDRPKFNSSEIGSGRRRYRHCRTERRTRSNNRIH